MPQLAGTPALRLDRKVKSATTKPISAVPAIQSPFKSLETPTKATNPKKIATVQRLVVFAKRSSVAFRSGINNAFLCQKCRGLKKRRSGGRSGNNVNVPPSSRRGVPAADRVRLAMDMLSGMVRVQNDAFEVCQAEMKHARLAVIDPDHRMIMMFGHGVYPLTAIY
jgi:hypothetical protein